MRARRLVALAAIALASATLAWSLLSAPLLKRLFEPLEQTTLDWRFRTAATGVRTSDEVALVLFDSASVAEWPYLSPFPRPVLAALIETVAAAGARAIAVDVYLDRLYPELDAIGGGDARLRTAVDRAGNVVLVARTDMSEGGERVLRPPHPYFADVANAVGIAELPTPYEAVRDAVLVVRSDAGLVAGLGLALYALHNGVHPDSLLAEAERTGTLAVPALSSRQATIGAASMKAAPLAFRGPPSRTDAEGGAFPAYSASVLLQLGELVPPEWFSGRTVLIGSGFHAEDRFRSPFFDHVDGAGRIGGWMYGTEVHATALHGLLAGGVPRPLGGAPVAVLLLVTALAVATATLLRGAQSGAAAAGALLVGVVVVAWRAFDGGALHVPVVAPSLSLGFALGLSTAYLSAVEGREKRRIRAAFARYVAPDVVSELVRDPERLRLSGEKRELSILFADLVGFTSLAESTSPERLVSLLNEYLDAMASCILVEGGTLDKYMGDAVMALFGAPRQAEHHAADACRAALRMQRTLATLSAGWQQRGWPALHMRIGIHSGVAIVGNIGGEQRFDYTALGDAVNLAARLEPACARYGVRVLISQATRDAAGSAIGTRALDVITVRGRSEPVRVYELLEARGIPAADAPDPARAPAPALTTAPATAATRTQS